MSNFTKGHNPCCRTERASSSHFPADRLSGYGHRSSLASFRVLVAASSRRADVRGRSLRDRSKQDAQHKHLGRDRGKQSPEYLRGLPGNSGFDPLKMGEDPQTLPVLRLVFLQFQHREAEVMHARWAMLGVVGLILPDLLGDPLYLLPDLLHGKLLPLGLWLAVGIGGVELWRAAAGWKERDVNQRIYPGRRFDPLGLTKGGDQQAERSAPGLGVFSAWLGGLPGWLSGGWWMTQRGMTRSEMHDMQTKELNNGRLAMVSFLGVYIACMMTGKGPVTLLMDHVADPLHNTVLQTLHRH